MSRDANEAAAATQTRRHGRPVLTEREEYELQLRHLHQLRNHYLNRRAGSYRPRPPGNWTNVVHVVPPLLWLGAVAFTIWYFLQPLTSATTIRSQADVALKAFFLHLPVGFFYSHLAAVGLTLLAYAVLRPSQWRSKRLPRLWVAICLLSLVALATPVVALLP
jgi:hypothetical protein